MPEYEYSDAPWRFHAAPERPGGALDGWILPDGVAFDGSDPCVAYVEGVGSLDLSLILADALAAVTLSVPDAVTLCRVLNGVIVAEPPELAGQLLPLTIADADATEIEPGCDRVALVTTLERLPLAGTFAVIDAVERFWRGPHAGPGGIVAGLVSVGLIRPGG